MPGQSLTDTKPAGCADGNESQWSCERLYCPVHKCNTTAFGESSGLGTYDGACGCNFFYEDWRDPR